MTCAIDADAWLVVAATLAQRDYDFELAERLLIEAINVSNRIHGEWSSPSVALSLRLIQFYEDTETKENETLELRTTIGKFLEENSAAMVAPH